MVTPNPVIDLGPNAPDTLQDGEVLDAELGSDPDAQPLTAAKPPAPAAPATPPGPAPLDEATRQRLARAEALEQQMAYQDIQKDINTRVAQRVRSYEEQGWLPEQARRAGEDYRGDLQEYIKYAQQVHSQSQEAGLRQQVAERMSQIYGVPASELAGFERVNDMERHAKLLQRLQKYEQATEADKKGRVGPQKFDQSNPRPRGGGRAGYVERLRKGDALPSAAEIDRLTAGYLNR